MYRTYRRPPYLMPFFLLSLGVGLCGWYGMNWYELPRYTEPDIQASVEANLAIDLARMGQHLKPDDAGLARLRASISQEVRAEIDRDKQEAQRGFALGLICLVLAAGSAVLTRFNAGEQAKKSAP